MYIPASNGRAQSLYDSVDIQQIFFLYTILMRLFPETEYFLSVCHTLAHAPPLTCYQPQFTDNHFSQRFMSHTGQLQRIYGNGDVQIIFSGFITSDGLKNPPHLAPDSLLDPHHPPGDRGTGQSTTVRDHCAKREVPTALTIQIYLLGQGVSDSPDRYPLQLCVVIFEIIAII